MDITNISEDVVQYFAANNLPTLWSIPEALDEGPKSMKEALETIMDSISESEVINHANNPHFQFFYKEKSQKEQYRQARIEITRKAIDIIINKKRINALQNKEGILRPSPYNHNALKYLDIDKNFLIDTSYFTVADSRYIRNGYAFNLALSLPQENSSYWVNQVLLRDNKSQITKYIRLDPLLIQSYPSLPPMEYKMWVWGVPLDWERIRNLRDEQHGRWAPGPSTSVQIEFTDVNWIRRDDEIHFICEEVPCHNVIFERGSRYFHAIYHPSEDKFVHIDGAIRYYLGNDLEERLKTHVRKAGKLGTRVKIFQIEGKVSIETFSSLASAFFVWNMDVGNYFAGRKE